MVELVVRPSTKETFAISAIENGTVYLDKLSHLVSFTCSQLDYFYFSLDGILVYCRVTLSALHSLYTGVERSAAESQGIAQSATQ